MNWDWGGKGWENSILIFGPLEPPDNSLFMNLKIHEICFHQNHCITCMCPSSLWKKEWKICGFSNFAVQESQYAWISLTLQSLYFIYEHLAHMKKNPTTFIFVLKIFIIQLILQRQVSLFQNWISVQEPNQFCSSLLFQNRIVQ